MREINGIPVDVSHNLAPDLTLPLTKYWWMDDEFYMDFVRWSYNLFGGEPQYFKIDPPAMRLITTRNGVGRILTSPLGLHLIKENFGE